MQNIPFHKEKQIIGNDDELDPPPVLLTESVQRPPSSSNGSSAHTITWNEVSRNSDVPVHRRCLAAIVGSMLSSFVVMPLDVVRVRLQSQTTTTSNIVSSRLHTIGAHSSGVPCPNLHKLNNAWVNRGTLLFPSRFIKSRELPSVSGFYAQVCCWKGFWTDNIAKGHAVMAPAASALTSVSRNSTVASTGSVMLNLSSVFTSPAAATLNGSSGECCVAQEVHGNRIFSSTLDALRKIARYEGITALWRGLTPTLLMAVPANVVYLSGYEWLRYSVSSPLRRIHSLREMDRYTPLLAGSLARIFATVLVSPVELLRTRMQAVTPFPISRVPTHSQSLPLTWSPPRTTFTYRSDPVRSNSNGMGELRKSLYGLREMVRHHGFLSLWRGISLTLWRDAPFSAIYWYCYEMGRAKLTEWRERRRCHLHRRVHQRHDTKPQGNLPILSNSRMNVIKDSFISGAVSGCIATVITQPFDVGKTIKQVSNSSPPTHNSKAYWNLSMMQLLYTIYRDQGIRGLFKGCTARVLKVAPACAIMISTYECGK